MSDREMAKIEREIRAKAKRRARAKMGLYWHVFVFVMAGAAMVAINQNYTPDHNWVVWPLCAWGAALAMHAFATLSGGNVSESMIQAEIQREKERRGLV